MGSKRAWASTLREKEKVYSLQIYIWLLLSKVLAPFFLYFYIDFINNVVRNNSILCQVMYYVQNNVFVS